MSSRVGKKPIPIPNNVMVQVKGAVVEIKGPMGTLLKNIPEQLSVELTNQQLSIAAKDETSTQVSQIHGLTRSLIANMVLGVVQPWKKELEIQGVGYRAAKSGATLQLQLGYSHPVEFKVPDMVQFSVDAKQVLISLMCPDKELLGITAAKIRSLRPPEPYKGKGVRYLGEQILRKAGKAAGTVGTSVAGAKK